LDAVWNVLPMPISYHFVIFLDGISFRRKIYPSIFENMCLQVDGFIDFVGC